MGPVSSAGPISLNYLDKYELSKNNNNMQNDKGKKERYERFFYQAERGSNERISD